MKKRIFLCFFFLIVFPSLCRGSEAYFLDACARWPKVPPVLALAIARHESGMNPWAVNVSGRSYMLNNQEEALRIANTAWAAGQSFDVGLMQINSRWMRQLQISPAVALEPRNNVLLGVWILAQEISRHGLTWKAVAGYHTPNPERGKRYARAIIRQLQQAMP